MKSVSQPRPILREPAQQRQGWLTPKDVRRHCYGYYVIAVTKASDRFFLFFRFLRWGETELLGTSVTNWPIVLAPDYR
jgi:hypothetical protein